jgi:hypothetical protein
MPKCPSVSQLRDLALVGGVWTLTGVRVAQNSAVGQLVVDFVGLGDRRSALTHWSQIRLDDRVLASGLLLAGGIGRTCNEPLLLGLERVDLGRKRLGRGRGCGAALADCDHSRLSRGLGIGEAM